MKPLGLRHDRHFYDRAKLTRGREKHAEAIERIHELRTGYPWDIDEADFYDDPNHYEDWLLYRLFELEAGAEPDRVDRAS